MKTNYKNLIIDGEFFEEKKLKEKIHQTISNNATPEWKKENFEFIKEWLDNSPTIKAHTSGTTGTPKEIFLQKEKMIASAKHTGGFFELKKNDKALSCLSPKYIAGKMMIVRAFVLGLDLRMVEPNGNPLATVKESIDFAAMIPLQVFNSIQNEKELKIFRKIKKTIIGGGVVSQALHDFLKRERNQCFATYGMTETITHIAVKKLNGADASDNYQALKNVQIKKDNRGCLVIEAPDVAEETVVTNDLVEIVASNQFRWLGRYDNVINSGGVKIISEKVERILNQFLTRRFFVNGLLDKKLGERLILIIEGEAFSEGEKKELMDSMKTTLPKYSIPKEILFIEKFEETDSGKVKRKTTMAMLNLT